MKLEMITVGTVVNAHGIRGDVKVLPRSTEPSVFTSCRTIYIDDVQRRLTSCREHKGCLLMKIDGIEDMDAALDMKGKTVSVRRSDLRLPQGYCFDEELVGLKALDAATGEEIGTLEEVQDYPAHKIYAVRGGKDEYLIPAVPAFISKVDLDGGTIHINVWEGLGTHED